MAATERGVLSTAWQLQEKEINPDPTGSLGGKSLIRILATSTMQEKDRPGNCQLKTLETRPELTKVMSACQRSAVRK
jgi:hypothetical protein